MIVTTPVMVRRGRVTSEGDVLCYEGYGAEENYSS
jgi:hypothetical protein